MRLELDPQNVQDNMEQIVEILEEQEKLRDKTARRFFTKIRNYWKSTHDFPFMTTECLVDLIVDLFAEKHALEKKIKKMRYKIKKMRDKRKIDMCSLPQCPLAINDCKKCDEIRKDTE